jgi:thioredoxin reductase
MMTPLIESILIYSFVAIFFLGIVIYYVRNQNKKSRIVAEKIEKAKKAGLYEPVSLHPVIDVGSCIQTGACIEACPEEDILGIVNHKATTVNASRCIGHGACFHACPTEAISLAIGTEKRGVDLPHVNPSFETNVPGMYIAGELGGMGLIKNAVEQGKQATDNLVKTIDTSVEAEYDLVIVGAGPAGIGASLTAKKHKLKFITVEQDSLGGTVFTFPRSKIVMTSAMELPLHGKVKFYETSKTELIDLWNEVLTKNDIEIKENTKIDHIEKKKNQFIIQTAKGEIFTSRKVLLAIGRRGTPRKLGVSGENTEKVAYRLLEAESIEGKNIMVVGGGDSAIEAALLLADQNTVQMLYRGRAFNRAKPKNESKIKQAIENGKINVRFHSNITYIDERGINIKEDALEEESFLPADRVYIFAGGELPIQFLQKSGIEITRKFGEAVLTHKK